MRTWRSHGRPDTEFFTQPHGVLIIVRTPHPPTWWSHHRPNTELCTHPQGILSIVRTHNNVHNHMFSSSPGHRIMYTPTWHIMFLSLSGYKIMHPSTWCPYVYIYIYTHTHTRGILRLICLVIAWTQSRHGVFVVVWTQNACVILSIAVSSAGHRMRIIYIYALVASTWNVYIMYHFAICVIFWDTECMRRLLIYFCVILYIQNGKTVSSPRLRMCVVLSSFVSAYI